MLLPSFTVSVTMPFALDAIEGNQQIARILTKAGKEQLAVEIARHHRWDLPSHFQRGNRRKYKHFTRSPVTHSRKQRRRIPDIDLVKSGRTRDVMTAGWKRMQVGGRFSNSGGKLSGSIHATAYYRFPFPIQGGLAASGAQRVTPYKMALEIEQWTPEQVARTQQSFGRAVTGRVSQLVKGRRITRSTRQRLGF